MSIMYWHEVNETCFDGLLREPFIVLRRPADDAHACFDSCTGGGTVAGPFGRTMLYIDPALPPRARDYVLLHEMIHQWQREVLRDWTQAHGQDFCDKVNEVGRRLHVPPVRESEDYLHWPLHTPLVAAYAAAGLRRRAG